MRQKKNPKLDFPFFFFDVNLFITKEPTTTHAWWPVAAGGDNPYHQEAASGGLWWFKDDCDHIIPYITHTLIEH